MNSPGGSIPLVQPTAALCGDPATFATQSRIPRLGRHDPRKPGDPSLENSRAGEAVGQQGARLWCSSRRENQNIMARKLGKRISAIKAAKDDPGIARLRMLVERNRETSGYGLRGQGETPRSNWAGLTAAKNNVARGANIFRRHPVRNSVKMSKPQGATNARGYERVPAHGGLVVINCKVGDPRQT